MTSHMFAHHEDADDAVTDSQRALNATEIRLRLEYLTKQKAAAIGEAKELIETQLRRMRQRCTHKYENGASAKRSEKGTIVCASCGDNWDEDTYSIKTVPDEVK